VTAYSPQGGPSSISRPLRMAARPAGSSNSAPAVGRHKRRRGSHQTPAVDLAAGGTKKKATDCRFFGDKVTARLATSYARSLRPAPQRRGPRAASADRPPPIRDTQLTGQNRSPRKTKKRKPPSYHRGPTIRKQMHGPATMLQRGPAQFVAARHGAGYRPSRGHTWSEGRGGRLEGQRQLSYTAPLIPPKVGPDSLTASSACRNAAQSRARRPDYNPVSIKTRPRRRFAVVSGQIAGTHSARSEIADSSLLPAARRALKASPTRPRSEHRGTVLWPPGLSFAQLSAASPSRPRRSPGRLSTASSVIMSVGRRGSPVQTDLVRQKVETTLRATAAS